MLLTTLTKNSLRETPTLMRVRFHETRDARERFSYSNSFFIQVSSFILPIGVRLDWLCLDSLLVLEVAGDANAERRNEIFGL